MYKRVLFSILCLLVVVFADQVYAEQPATQESVETLQRKVAELEADLIRVNAIKEHYKFLKEENERFRQFIEQERNEMRLFYESLLTKLATIITAIVAVFGFLGWKTLADCRNKIVSMAKKKMDEIKRQAEEQLELLVNESVGHVRNNIESLRQIIERETQYRKSRVVAIGTAKDLDEMVPEISLLQKKGIDVIKQPHPVLNLTDQIKRDEVDIVLYRYNTQGAQQDPDFKQVVQILSNSLREIPILVYAPSERVAGDDLEVLRNYSLYNYANTAATLVGNLYTFTHIFSGGGR